MEKGKIVEVEIKDLAGKILDDQATKNDVYALADLVLKNMEK